MTRGAVVVLLRSGVLERKKHVFPALVNDEAVDGVGGGVAEELDLIGIRLRVALGMDREGWGRKHQGEDECGRQSGSHHKENLR
jgi:hypothetical protein